MYLQKTLYGCFILDNPSLEIAQISMKGSTYGRWHVHTEDYHSAMKKGKKRNY